jgi:hypothetical protein
MKRIFGALLALAGALCLFLFASRGIHAGRNLLGTQHDPSVPFRALGLDYPADGLLLLGTFWGFILGLWFILTGDAGASRALKGGGVARLLLLNALLLVSSLFVGFVGGRSGANPSAVAVFGMIALAQVVVGLILLILACMEKPKGIVSLALGGLVWLGGTAAGILVFLWGGA